MGFYEKNLGFLEKNLGFLGKIWGFQKKKLGFLGLMGDYMVDDYNDMEFREGKKKCYGWYGIRINGGITSKCVSKVQSQYKK